MTMKKMRDVVAFALAMGLLLVLVGHVSASSNSTIYSFGTTQPLDGAVPKGSLTYVNGLMFGRTTTITPGCSETRDLPRALSGDGVIFHFDPTNVTATYTIDHVFTGNPDGENPRHDAMTLLNGQLFGTTLQGGTKNTGIIFSIAQNGSSYAVLTSLHKSTGDESHSCFVVVNNMGNNLLYGMTESGGDNDGGVIFSFDPSTLNYQPVYSFDKPTGHEPHGRLTLDPNGTTLYGMTRKGGSSSYGVVFSVDISTSNYQVLHDFMGSPSDAATTDHGYVVQSGNALYGMTTYGGPSNNGVIFKLTTNPQTYGLLHCFGATRHDGKQPYGSLLLVGNQLYGTTAKGGDNDLGTVFIIFVNSALYGMTTEGGDSDQGTIFKVSP